MRASVYLVIAVATWQLALARCPLEVCEEEYYAATWNDPNYNNDPVICKNAVYAQKNCIEAVKANVTSNVSSSACECDTQFLSDKFTWASEHFHWDIQWCDDAAMYNYMYVEKCTADNPVRKFMEGFNNLWWNGCGTNPYAYSYNSVSLEELMNLADLITNISSSAATTSCNDQVVVTDQNWTDCKSWTYETSPENVPYMMEALDAMCTDGCPLQDIANQCWNDAYMYTAGIWTHCKEADLQRTVSECITSNITNNIMCLRVSRIDMVPNIQTSYDSFVVGCNNEETAKAYKNGVCMNVTSCDFTSVYTRSSAMPGAFLLQRELHEKLYQLRRGMPVSKAETTDRRRK